MKPTHFPTTVLAIPVLALMFHEGKPAAIGQQMEHAAPSAPSTGLTIKTYKGKTLAVTPEELAAARWVRNLTSISVVKVEP